MDHLDHLHHTGKLAKSHVHLGEKNVHQQRYSDPDKLDYKVSGKGSRCYRCTGLTVQVISLVVEWAKRPAFCVMRSCLPCRRHRRSRPSPLWTSRVCRSAVA